MNVIASVTRHPYLELFTYGLASLVIYLVGFALPYNLFIYWRTPGLTIAKITQNDPRYGAAYVLAMLSLFLLNWLACRTVLREHRLAAWFLIIGGAIAFNAVMLSLYPVDAVDVFDNIIRGRMQSLYGANPFYQHPASFPQDPFIKYSGWNDFTSAYGPWWELLTSFVSRLPGNGIIANVLAFKALSVLAYAGTSAVIALTLRRHAPDRALFGTTLFAWNPLVLYSVAGNGHNDAVMVFFMVLGFFFLSRGNFTLAALSEVAGALVKFIPALLIPIVYIAALRKLGSWKERIGFVVLTSAAAAVMVAVTYARYWRGGDVLGLDWRSTLFTTSLATLVQIVLIPSLGTHIASEVVSRGSLLLVAAWIAWQVWQVWRATGREEGERVTRGDLEEYARAGLLIVLFFLLVGTPWFQPWYAIWPIALAALSPDGVLLRGGVVVSMAAAAKMPVFDYVLSYRPGIVPPRNVLEWQATPATLGVAWLYFAYQFAKLWLARNRQGSVSGPSGGASAFQE